MANTAPTTDPSRGQFTLRSLLVLTTAAAVLAAIGSMAGRGWVMVLIGAFLALANYLGILAVVQRPRFAQVVLYLTMIPFAVSFFLPTAMLWSWSHYQTEEMTGWRAIYEMTTSNIPRGFAISSKWTEWILVAGFFIALIGNLVMCGLPLVAHRVVVGKAQWYMYLVTLAALVAWLGVLHILPLEEGYYVWCAALTVPLVVVRLERRRLIALLLALAAGVGLIWEVFPRR